MLFTMIGCIVVSVRSDRGHKEFEALFDCRKKMNWFVDKPDGMSWYEFERERDSVEDRIRVLSERWL
jgi:hypothetical protein